MRIAFISDLHANVTALEAVLADIESVGVDETICLGDIVDLGPLPSEVVALLRARNIPCIRGNHDTLDEEPGYWLLDDIEKWSKDQLSTDELAWLDGLPARIELEIDGVNLLCVHGSPRSDTENMNPHTTEEEFKTMLEGVTADVIVAGHTHLPLVRRVASKLVVNVGSVGLAFEAAFQGEPPRVLSCAEYGIVSIERGVASAELRRIPVDVDDYAESVRASGMPHNDAWLAHWDTESRR